MRHCGTQPFSTSRLLLRRITLDDVQTIYETWCTDPEVCRFLRWTPHPSPDVTRALVQEWVDGYASELQYQWLIVRREDDRVLGCIGVIPSEQDKTVLEPGYCLGRAFWGQGYMTEALAGVVAYMFDTVGADKLACCHAIANPASGRVMQKCGFRYQNEDVYHKYDGTAVPCLCYELTKEQYDTGKQATP